METKEISNAILKEKMTDAMVERGYLTQDLNATFQPGVYRVSLETTPNCPNWMVLGVIEVSASGSFVIQKYFARNSWAYAMAWRCGHSQDLDWRNWVFIPSGTPPT